MDSSTSDLSAVDSTAKLLQDLHLMGRNRHGKHMDTMETDPLLEVPDTPDRLATTCPVEEIGEEAARRTYHQPSSNFGLRGEGTSSSNAFDNESLFRKARLASLISKPCDVELYRVEKEFPFGIPYPTRHRSDRRMAARDLCGEDEIGGSDYLKNVVSSPRGPIERTHNGLADLLSDGAGEKGTNEFATSSGVSEHCSTDCITESIRNGNRIKLASDSQATTEKAAAKTYPRRLERRRLVLNGLISPNNIKEKSPLVNGKSSSSYVGRSDLDKGKGIDLSNNSQNKSERTLLQQQQFVIPWKNPGQRKLVRNGCISPSNIAKNSKLTTWKREGIGRLGSHEVQDSFSSLQLHIVSPDSEPRGANEMKEKVFPNDGRQVNGQGTNSSFMSSRELSWPGKEKMISSEAIADTWPADDISFKTTQNHTWKAAQHSSQEASVVSNRKDDSCHLSDQHPESVLEGINVNMLHCNRGTDSLEAAGLSSCVQESHLSQVEGHTDLNSDLKPVNERHCGAERLTRGKRKSSSTCTILGECSSSGCSTFPESEILHPQSSVAASSAKSMRGRSSECHGVTLGPIIDVDELPSPLLGIASDHNESCVSSAESAARALQVESDEMLARQLQEQFFNESSNFGGAEEIDATIALALQQEEDSQRTSLIGSHGQSFPRNPSIAHLYRRYPRESSMNSSVRSTSRARSTSSARMAQLRRNMRRGMDIETRLNFLEALEVAFNNGNDLRSDILQVRRDFNENDYEMLLALDDDNQHVGASHHQINSLPQTVIQAESVEESCAICLENPSVGDRIRHLPCLHKFHKDCIDTWLRRRTSCPICKSDII